MKTEAWMRHVGFGLARLEYVSSKFYREAFKAERHRAETELADGIEEPFGNQDIRKREGRNRDGSKVVAACSASSCHGDG